MSKFLVLGGAGAQGSAVVVWLVKEPDVSEVICADINLEKAKRFADKLKSDKMRPMKVDAWKSDEVFEAIDALPELIQTLYEYGSTYLQRNQEGDREKAHNLLDQALEISRKIGAKKWIEKIIAKKKLLTA